MADAKMRKGKQGINDKRLAFGPISCWIPCPFLFHACPRFAPPYARRVLS